ncbi:MAG: hypothetical protein FJX59_04895 [Alphaproteobacteria bacterium]|nr:hypothetical protein [Alphaproteobacteria bacterium]
MTVRRRSVLAAAALSSICAPVAAATVQGKITAQALVDSPWDRHWDEFKSAIAKRPDIAFEYFIRGETGNEEQMLTALRRNRVQIGGITLTGLAGIIPESAVPMLPYMFESEAEVDFVFDNFLAQSFREMLRDKGLVFLQWSEVGWNMLYSTRPIRTPADIRGMKVRGSPNFAALAFLDAVGANAVPLGIADITPALQTGLVDGGLSSLTFFYYGFRQFASDLTRLNQWFDQGIEMANAEWWDSLTPDQRTAIASAFVPGPRSRANIRALGDSLLADLAKSGTRIHDLTPDERRAWIDASASVHERVLTEIGGRSRDIYAAIQDGKRAFAAGK